PTLAPLGDVKYTPGGDPVKGTFNFSAQFDLTLTVTDNLSHQSADIQFYGSIYADTFPDSPGPSVTMYAGWLGWSWERFAPLLGAYSYLVDGAPSSASLLTDDGGSVPLFASVSVGGADAGAFPVWTEGPDPEPIGVPEPSALLLGGCGLAMSGLARLR